MRRGRGSCGGAPMTIRSGEAADGLASNEVGDEFPFLDERYTLGFHAFVIERVVAEQGQAGNGGNRWIVEHSDKIRQHAGFVAAGPFPRRAGVLAELRFSAENIRLHQIGADGSGGIVRKQDRATVFLVDDRGVAQQFQRLEDPARGLQELFAGGEILEFVPLVGMRPLQQHAVGSLGGAGDGDDVARTTGARNRTLGVQEVTVLDRETQRGFEALQFFVDAIFGGSLFEKMNPGNEVSRRKTGERLDGFDSCGFGEIVNRLIYLQLLQGSLLGGERFGGGFVSAIGGEPDAVANRKDVIVGWNEVDGSFSGAEKTVLLVVADPDYDAQQAAVIMLLVAQGAENGAGFDLVDLRDAVFDVVRCLHILEFQLCFGPVHLLTKSA